VTGWIMSDLRSLAPDKKDQPAICDTCPELAALRGHVTAFARLMTEYAAGHVEGWPARQTRFARRHPRPTVGPLIRSYERGTGKE
jgi:hypothetical protein